MSRPGKRDGRKAGQLSCWVGEENLERARDLAAARGEDLWRFVDRALERENKRAEREASAKDESDEA